MQFPESWLREFCNPPVSTQQLADLLTMAGLEVEDLRPMAPAFSQVVVGEIKEAVQHPNADRLRVCQVDAGQANLLTIVCGAPNARAGIKVPCALVGAVLPPGEDGKPFQIKVGKLRGVESQGMLCSARELKLSDEHSGLLELDLNAVVGQDIRQHLQLDDTLFTLKLTPNLAHCLSVYGIAREVAALTGAALNTPTIQPVHSQIKDVLKADIQAKDLCGRFSGRIIRHVNPKAATPAWMVERLARCGQRSVSALVDISNYVMFEYGRPSHIFDLEKIHGSLQVRWGRAGEQLKLLNGHEIEVDEKVGVIADDVQVESLAGIMGGDATAVSDDTRHIYVEAAFWWPQAVAGRSRRFNFSTDAGHRFERGVDPSLTVEHIERISQLVIDICGTATTQCGPIDDQVLQLPSRKPVSLRVDRANKIIGTQLSQQRMEEALTGLGLQVEAEKGLITVRPPAYRFDLEIEEDLIEEIARMVGYQHLPTTPPLAPITARLRPEHLRHPFELRRSIAALGYQETINYSFVEERWEAELAANQNPIRLLNPIASQMSVMRSSLLGSLLQVVKFNSDRKADSVRVFEIGRVFIKDASVADSDHTVQGFHQPMRVAGMAFGAVRPLQWAQQAQPVDFFDVKADVQALLAAQQPVFEPAQHPAMHPGRCARVLINRQEVGFVGELHPRWKQTWELPQTTVMFELDLDAVLKRPVASFSGVSRFQAVERDIAVIVAEQVSHAELMAAIYSADSKGLLRDAVLFDVYRPKQAGGAIAPGEKSLAVRLSLNSDEATLTEADIESVVSAVISHLAQTLNARLRA
jgi:phenylalanyl-tRNA synthetase beta chain